MTNALDELRRIAATEPNKVLRKQYADELKRALEKISQMGEEMQPYLAKVNADLSAINQACENIQKMTYLAVALADTPSGVHSMVMNGRQYLRKIQSLLQTADFSLEQIDNLVKASAVLMAKADDGQAQGDAGEDQQAQTPPPPSQSDEMEPIPEADNAYYTVFHRTWWRRNPSKPNGLEPGAGPKHIIQRHVKGAEAARDMCRVWNANHQAGKLSDKAEFTRE